MENRAREYHPVLYSGPNAHISVLIMHAFQILSIFLGSLKTLAVTACACAGPNMCFYSGDPLLACCVDPIAEL
jgi:hypothetical protein